LWGDFFCFQVPPRQEAVTEAVNETAPQKAALLGQAGIQATLTTWKGAEGQPQQGQRASHLSVLTAM